MKQRDHRALAYYLQEVFSEKDFLEGWRWRFFLIGNICPDYNLFTYMRGMRKSRGMLGHNLPYSQEYIQKRLKKLQRDGIRSFRDFFLLGTLMHYLADSFTYPHTLSKGIPIELHRAYEWRLHSLMKARLQEKEREVLFPSCQRNDLISFLGSKRNEYEKMERGVRTDCMMILSVCTAVFEVLCKIEGKMAGA